MGYFDKSIDKHFNLNADGKQVVYPWNANRGYILPNVQQYFNMRSAIRRKLIIDWLRPFYMGLISFYIFSSNTEPVNYFEAPLMIVAALAIIDQLKDYDLRRIPRRCLVTLEKQVVVDTPPLFNSKILLIISFLFLIGSAVGMWQLSAEQDLIRFILMLVIITSAFFCILNIRSIMIKRTRSSQKIT
jgi:hypothetical protein